MHRRTKTLSHFHSINIFLCSSIIHKIDRHPCQSLKLEGMTIHLVFQIEQIYRKIQFASSQLYLKTYLNQIYHVKMPYAMVSIVDIYTVHTYTIHILLHHPRYPWIAHTKFINSTHIYNKQPQNFPPYRLHHVLNLNPFNSAECYRLVVEGCNFWGRPQQSFECTCPFYLYPGMVEQQ